MVGGIVADGLAIYDTIHHIKQAVSTLCSSQNIDEGHFISSWSKGNQQLSCQMQE